MRGLSILIIALVAFLASPAYADDQAQANRLTAGRIVTVPRPAIVTSPPAARAPATRLHARHKCGRIFANAQ